MSLAKAPPFPLTEPYLNELSADNLLYQLLLAAGEEGDVGGGEGGGEALQGGRCHRVDRQA